MRIENAMKPTAPAHEDDDERLEQARQRLHARLDLRVVGAATFSSICSSWPLFSPTAIMCVTIGGKLPLRLSGSAMLSPFADRAGGLLDDLLEQRVVEHVARRYPSP